MAVTLGWLLLFSEVSAEEERQKSIHFAMQRAALELGAGRPQSAAVVLQRLHLRSPAGRDEALAVLLWAESEILAAIRKDIVAVNKLWKETS